MIDDFEHVHTKVRSLTGKDEVKGHEVVCSSTVVVPMCTYRSVLFRSVCLRSGRERERERDVTGKGRRKRDEDDNRKGKWATGKVSGRPDIVEGGKGKGKQLVKIHSLTTSSIYPD